MKKHAVKHVSIGPFLHMQIIFFHVLVYEFVCKTLKTLFRLSLLLKNFVRSL